MHSSVVGHLGCFHSLAIAAINMAVQMPFLLPNLHYFRYIPISSIGGSYEISIFGFLRRLHTVFHSGFSKFTLSPAVHEGSFFPTSSPAFVAFIFLMVAILKGVN
jgi:hypothetical protein